MAAFIPKRLARGQWGQVDWRDIGERSLRAAIVAGWFGFVITMLALALERAP